MKKQIFLVVSVVLFNVSIAFAQTPPPPASPAIQIADGAVLNGKAISLAKPEFPAAAKAVRASGAVNDRVMIDEEGNVVSAAAISGHPLLRQASEQAARASRFSPTTLSGQAVKVTGVIVYNFIPPKTESSNEKKLEIMGLAAYLTILDLMPDGEWKEIGQEDLRSLPQIANELMPLAFVTKATTKQKRSEIVEKVSAALENKLSGADAWQFQFGKAFATMMREVRSAGLRADKTLDETAVKTNLLKMRDLIFTAPADTPPDVLDKFKELVKFADTPDLNDNQTKLRFVGLVVETLQTISPDLPK